MEEAARVVRNDEIVTFEGEDLGDAERDAGAVHQHELKVAVMITE